MKHLQQSSFGHFVDQIEETLIAFILGMMTLITFANVVTRYVFNSNLLWALEATVFLFAWLVLIGASYCVKKNLHLGIDLLANVLPPKGRRLLALLAVAACILFAILMVKGSWDYWYPFITKRAFLETDDIPIPEFMQFMADALNEGERYEKLPRFIPYFALPLGMVLLLYRFLQLSWQVWVGEVDLIIASHEAEDMEETMSTHPIGED
ncbi:MAG: C4-dicarboxylate ABC transporter permease [Rhodospirillaceae bacterium]|nr:MAG: C4-dicarboxylate ABC transporter permease [Rhodospirillaceae bacterium]